MVDRIFYSWQSDRSNATNRGFIERALEQAAKRIRSDGTLSVEPVVDRDTADVPGSPDIASTIFTKIESASVFVADVTDVTPFTGPQSLFARISSAFRPRTPRPRLTPNPNVLVELGYAVGKLGWHRVVLVVNTAFGRVEDLPFDLRQRRVLTYNCAGAGTKTEERQALGGKLENCLRDILALPSHATEPVAAPEVHPALEIPKPQALGHPYYAWDVLVRVPDATCKTGWSRSLRHCTVRVFSDDLLHPAFQPADEKKFLDEVRASFPEDSACELDEPNAHGVTVKNHDAQLRFDRTWTRGSIDDVGVAGLAVTLPIVGVPELYSLADVSVDVVRFLQMVAVHLGSHQASVWLELSAPALSLMWAGSEAARRSRAGGFLAESKPGRDREVVVAKSFDAGRLLADQVVEATAELLQIAITQVHQERIERSRVAALLGRALDGERRSLGSQSAAGTRS